MALNQTGRLSSADTHGGDDLNGDGLDRRVFAASAGAPVAETPMAGTPGTGAEPARRHAAPAAAGAGVAEGRPARPFWLSQPCPSWCTSRHADRDHPSERQHVSAVQGGVTLTQSEAVEAPDGSWRAQDIQIFLAQHVREIEPLIRCNGQGPVGAWQLTVAEAEALATALSQAVAATRGR
jgi:hypothetical protein